MDRMGPDDLLSLMGRADEVKVFDLVEHLRKAFDAYFAQNTTLQPHTYRHVDLFMAAHNFHKLVVLNLLRVELSHREWREWQDWTDEGPAFGTRRWISFSTAQWPR